MSSIMFYEEIVPLDKIKHKGLKLDPSSGLTFAKDANSIAVAGFEFFEASRSFPIFFIKNKDDSYIPIAILSFRKQGHDLGESRWDGEYVPAFMRRYPFMLSNDGVVVIDEKAPHLSETEGNALFNEDGEASEYLTKHIEFLKVVDQGFRMTEQFCSAAKEKELFKKFEGKLQFAQGEVNLGDVHVIDEKKLHEALSEAEVYEWFNKGWLAWCHAHLHSIGSVNEIIRRAVKSAPKQPQSPETQEPSATEEQV